jgi:CRISPR type IV-associated protein Csf1
MFNLTPTQFICEIALKTGQAESPRKIVEYEDIEYQNVNDKYCWLCGGEINGKGQSINKAIKNTFMDYDRAMMRDSNSICQGCSFCLSKSSLRNYSILVTGDYLKHPGRNEWREILFDPPEPPFLAILSVSGQKWLHFKSEIAEDIDFFPIMLEEMPVTIDRKLLRKILNIFEILYSNGFSKTEIETGEYKQHRILEFGIEKWEKLEESISKYRGNGLFNVVNYIAQEQEELKIKKEGEEKECITTSKQTKEKKQLQLF